MSEESAEAVSGQIGVVKRTLPIAAAPGFRTVSADASVMLLGGSAHVELAFMDHSPNLTGQVVETTTGSDGTSFARLVGIEASPLVREVVRVKMSAEVAVDATFSNVYGMLILQLLTPEAARERLEAVINQVLGEKTDG